MSKKNLKAIFYSVVITFLFFGILGYIFNGEDAMVFISTLSINFTILVCYLNIFNDK